MTENLPRVLQNIFGENAMQGNKIAQFGSVIAGAPLYTGDIEEIQALQYWQNGWVGATISDKRYPTSEETTGINKVVTQQLKYLFQKGIPEWLDTEDYYENSFCQRQGVVYKSVTDNNINNDPLTDSGANWQVFRGASVSSDLEIIMPYTKKAIINSTLQLQNNTLEVGGRPYINFNISDDGANLSGFSNSAWIMLSLNFPSNVTNKLSFEFSTTVPNIDQFLVGNGWENCLRIEDGLLAFILNGVSHKTSQEYELEASHRYIVDLEHSTTGYTMSLKNSVDNNLITTVIIPAPFNAWSGMSMFVGKAPDKEDSYLRGVVGNNLYINIDGSTSYYNMSTNLQSIQGYITVNGQVTAWCPNGRKAEDSTLNNSVQTFTFNNVTILDVEEKDLYCHLPGSNLVTGVTFEDTVTPEDATNGDVWYNPSTNIYQRIITRNPNIFNNGCTITGGNVTGFAANKYLQLDQVLTLTDPWSLTLNITGVATDTSTFIGFAGMGGWGQGFQLYTSWSVDHFAYGVQKEYYSNESGAVAAVGEVNIDEDGNATGFTGKTNYLNLTPSQTYSGGAWSDIWCVTLNTLIDNAVLIGDDNTYNGYVLKINNLGQISLSVTFNGSSWGITSLTSATGSISANTKTFIKVEFAGNQYAVRVSTNGNNWTTVISTNNSSTMSIAYPLALGGGSDVAIDGTIHLRQCSVYFNNATIWTGNAFSYGFVQQEGVNNSFVTTGTQVYQDSNFTTPLAQASGSDFYYNTSHDQIVWSDTNKSTTVYLFRDPVQKVYKQTQQGTSYGVAYQGAIGYVAVEGLIGSFVPAGETVYNDANLTTVIDTASGSNYVYLGQSHPIYTYQYGYAKTNGEAGQYLSSGILIYSDVNATNTIATSSGTDYIYMDDFSISAIGELRVKQTQSEQSITLSWDGATYTLSAEGETATLSSTDPLRKEGELILGRAFVNSSNSIQSLFNCTLNLNTSTFSFWKWNGISNPTSQWTQFIGVKIGSYEDWNCTLDYPVVLNSGESRSATIPVLQIDASNNLPVEIENVCVVANINNLNSSLIPNNTLILGYGGYI